MMNGSQLTNGRAGGPVAARELVVPQQFARMQHQMGELHEVIGELDRRLQPVLRNEATTPVDPTPKPEPDGSVMGQLQRYNDGIEIATARLRAMMALMEI